MAKAPKSGSASTPPTASPVSVQVLTSFVDAVAADKDLGAEIAKRLKKTLIDGRKFTDAALREALFGDVDT
ncbi:MAG TPA: hypothetical protein VMH86_01515 [Rhizomicrobium sp.]|nr:hypothetical protein [Rhizomicrobium sp.]